MTNTSGTVDKEAAVSSFIFPSLPTVGSLVMEDSGGLRKCIGGSQSTHLRNHPTATALLHPPTLSMPVCAHVLWSGCIVCAVVGGSEVHMLLRVGVVGAELGV